LSEQTLKRVLGALGIVAVLWLGSVLLSGRGGGGVASDDGDIASLFEGLNGTTVVAVQIVGPNQTVSLQRSGGSWTVNGNPADSLAVARLWNALSSAEVGEVLATNPANHERMGLSGDSARTVDFTLTDGGVASFLVGKPGPSFPSVFVRLPDHDEVVAVSGDLRPIVVQNVTRWRDKTILRVDTAAVVRVVLETDEGIHVAERADSSWSVDGEPANIGTIRSLLGALANLNAQEFVEDGEALEEDPTRVIALGADGDTLGIVVITGASGTNHARTPGRATVFEILSLPASRLTPAIESLRAADPDGA
jgi:hypothetical protein